MVGWVGGFGFPTLPPASYSSGVSGSPATYAETVLALSPTVYYRLGELSGTSVADASGNGNTATLHGAVTLGTTGLITGDSDKAMTFAAGQWIDGPVVALPTGAITLGGWWNGTVSGDGAIIGRWNSNQGAMVYLDPVNVYLYVNGLNSCAFALPSAARHFIVGTWDGTNARLYLDGALAAGPTAYAGPITAPAAVPLQVATYGNSTGGQLRGVIDEPFMCPTAISNGQQSGLYSKGV